jgi:hypothetical protein
MSADSLRVRLLSDIDSFREKMHEIAARHESLVALGGPVPQWKTVDADENMYQMSVRIAMASTYLEILDETDEVLIDEVVESPESLRLIDEVSEYPESLRELRLAELYVSTRIKYLKLLKETQTKRKETK